MIEVTPKVLNSCELNRNVENGQGKIEKCAQFFNFTQYIDGVAYCFTIFAQMNNEQDSNYEIHQPAQLAKIPLRLRLMKSNLSQSNLIRIQLHSRKEQVYFQSSNHQLFSI